MNDLHSFKDYLGLNKARIYNLEHRKKPAELVRKDLISAMKLPDHENLNKEHFLRILDPWREEWEKGVQVPVNPDALPKPEIKSFVESPQNFLASTLDSFNLYDHALSSSFQLPPHLIKYEDNPENSASYELDLQDICWLEAVNDSELNIKIPDKLIEDVINELEQQCIRNIKEHHIGIEYDDHIVCDVCQNPDAEDDNEMVFCELCNICVHQACYGILDIPIGDWFCNSCRDLGSKKNAVCALCPNVGGALKPTTKTNQWAHVSCAYWIPEVKFLNLSLLEPINIKGVSNWRWNLVCSLCNVKKGAPIICDDINCQTAYHVTCAFKHKLKMKIVLNENKSNVSLKSYCNRHSNEGTESPKKFTSEVDFISRNVTETEVAKNINPQHEFWKYVDINKLYQEMSAKYNEKWENQNNLIRDCISSPKLFHQIIDLIHQYWKLKRISNYGNSLIKLTFAQKFEEEMQFHQNKLVEFRFHLERLRTLSYMLCRREKIKEKYMISQKEIFINTCKLFGVCPTDQLENDSLNSSESREKNSELFKQIMRINNIYGTQNEQTADQNCNSTLNKADTNERLTPSVSAEDFGKSNQNKLDLEQQKEHSDKFANSIIRQLKRFSKPDRLRTPRTNPYAKFYFNSGNKRKNGFESENQPEREESSQCLENGQLSEPSNVTNERSYNSNSMMKKIKNVKKRLDMSLADEDSFFSSTNSFSDLSCQQSPKKILKLDLNPETNSLSKDFATKRIYNFRKISSNGFHIEEFDQKPPCSESHLKENGHYVNHSPQVEESFDEARSFERVTRQNKKDVSKLEHAHMAQCAENEIVDLKRIDRKTLKLNNENLKSDVNCLTAEIKNRYRRFNHYRNGRINSN